MREIRVNETTVVTLNQSNNRIAIQQDHGNVIDIVYLHINELAKLYEILA